MADLQSALIKKEESSGEEVVEPKKPKILANKMKAEPKAKPKAEAKSSSPKATSSKKDADKEAGGQEGKKRSKEDALNKATFPWNKPNDDAVPTTKLGAKKMKAEPKAAPKAEAKTEPEAVPKAAPNAVPKATPNAVPKAEPEAVPKAEPEWRDKGGGKGGTCWGKSKSMEQRGDDHGMRQNSGRSGEVGENQNNWRGGSGVWRPREDNTQGGRYGGRGGANANWHSARFKAQQQGREREFLARFPRNGRPYSSVDWY